MDVVRFQAPLSRADLAARTGLNRSTISSIVEELIDLGYIREMYLEDPTIGRPGMLLQVNSNGGFALGVEIGVDFISVILTNFVPEVLWHRTCSCTDVSQLSMMEQVENLIQEAMDFGKTMNLRPLGIGVGVPGLVDIAQGKLVYAPNMKWVDAPIRLILMQRFNVPVFVDNEANFGALGEFYYGIAKNVKDFIYLKTSMGLGAGIMIGGKLFRGVSGFAGEVGHITIYSDGERCGCGRRGCWETYISPPSVLRRVCSSLRAHPESKIFEIVEGDLEKITMDTLVEASRQADPLAIEVIKEVGINLAVGIANLVNVFNPALVVLGGTLSPFGPWVIPIIQEYLQENLLLPLRGNTPVVSSNQEENACLLGAIAFVLDDILREPVYSLH